MDDNQPKGIGFFNLKSGETHYGRLEPQIQAYINSSDLGINASRGQDFGWRLAPEWVKKVRAFREDENKMATLSAKLRLEDDQLPNLTQILYAIYGQQLRAAHTRAQGEENPFEEEYLQAIGSNVPSSNADPLDRYDEDGEATAAPVEQVEPPKQEEPASEQVEEVPAADGPKPTKAATTKSK